MEVAGLSVAVLAVAAVAVLVGAVVQGTVGFGLGLVATPAMALADPSLVPATILLVTTAMVTLSAFREVHAVDWSGLRWALLGRLPGTVVGVAVVAVLPPRGIAVVVAAVVLAAVVASATRWHARPTPRALTTGGFVAGITGTATAIGGPPVALLYQHVSGARLRSTMAMFFLVGSAVSVVALVVAGQIGRRDGERAAVLLPVLLVGFLVSGPLRSRLDAGWTRPAVLWLAGAAAVVLLVRSVLG